ncbi:polysaccharide deacetylase family protein [Sansalvadorimonas verongulae]|uniref:polysaccharide deacetylase family protein n=1 Tax=Sansalvadorimonas verongulae TaxID=2172824 RepID=UPI0012BB740F|nr:polysaccharide deacetylase family protein [Sansalvadorimonas verongulae]MTI15537.1 allantoinase [Sansalvadorimonas verongulae]
MPDYFPRNFHGYGANPPNIRWPHNKQLAVSVVVNYEEGSESCPLDGDGVSESWLTDIPGLVPSHHRHISCESVFNYGARAGAWRLIRTLQEFHVPATVFGCGLALERNPELTKAFHQAGWEIAGHGWRWLDYSSFSEEDECRHMARTLQVIEQLTGQKAKGWYTGRKSQYTRALAFHHGLSWDSDAYDDDIPYYVPIEGHNHLVIPYSLITNDCRYTMSPGWNSPEDAWHSLKAAFDTLYREGHEAPRMMTLALHSRLSGHPGRASSVRRFLEYALHHKGVWFCRRSDIAEHWRQQNQI